MDRGVNVKHNGTFQCLIEDIGTTDHGLEDAYLTCVVLQSETNTLLDIPKVSKECSVQSASSMMMMMNCLTTTFIYAVIEGYVHIALLNGDVLYLPVVP